MVQIITGTFGYYNGRKVIPITHQDGPQMFDPELEARLVRQGVAIYVGAPFALHEEPKQSPKQDDCEDTLYNAEMRLDRLKEIAACYGVDASSMRRKADVIKAIDEARNAHRGEDDSDEEEPPRLDAADPV